jgi:hypothetical protein
MEKQMRSNLNSNTNLNAATWNTKPNNVVLNTKEEPTITTRLVETEEKTDVWTQEQQALLEKALKEINKDTPNRWERIAEVVSNKTKVNY